MRSAFVRNTVLKATMVLPLVAACATANPGGQRPLSSGARLAYIRDSLLSARNDEAHAQPAGEPRVRIITSTTLDLNRTVDAAVRVSDDAYIIVVATDLDGRVRVVFPEAPQESGFVKAGNRYRLPTFFAGFGSQVFGRYGAGAFNSASARPRAPSGTLIAVASDRPLQLGRLADRNGDWDEEALERLILGRSVRSATYALGDHLVLTGQQFGTDYSGFLQSAGTSPYSLAMNNVGCTVDQTDAMNFYAPPATRYFARDGQLYAVVVDGDSCGGYYTHIVPVGPAPTRRDSVRTPGGRNDSSAAIPAAGNGSRGRFADARLDDVVARARRSSPVGDASLRVHPNEPPTIEPGLRFRPPEQLRIEPRPHERPKEPARVEPARVEPPRVEPARAEPPRAEPRRPRAEPARTGKPIRND